MIAPRSCYYICALAVLLVGCAGRTAAVNPVINSNSSDSKSVIQAGGSGTLRVFPVATNDNFERPIAVGSDGNVWFGAATASGSPELGRIDLNGKASYFPTENVNGVITGITNGPEGDVWFTSVSTTWKIGKMTTRGRVVFNETLPGGYGSQGGLAVGSDGDVWFPLGGPESAIGKSSRTGAVTIYPFPFAANGISGVARGADGNIWFTYFYPYGVAEITPDGTIFDFSAPLNEKLETNPVLATDGRIWFSLENDANPNSPTYQIGAIDIHGSWSFYDLPHQRLAGGVVNGMTLGPDGRVWFSQLDTIGGIDTKGVVSDVLTMPSAMLGGEVERLTTDAGGDVWFAQLTSNSLGVFKP